MQPTPPSPASAHWCWTWVSGLLLCWQLQLGAYSVGYLFIFFSWLCCPLRFQTPHRSFCERVSYCLETSPSQLPPQNGSSSITLLSSVFCPTSFRREWAAFLGAWCPPPAFRSCFVKVAQHSDDLLMNLWGRKWSPCPIPLPSSLHRLLHNKVNFFSTLTEFLSLCFNFHNILREYILILG